MVQSFGTHEHTLIGLAVVRIACSIGLRIKAQRDATIVGMYLMCSAWVLLHQYIALLSFRGEYQCNKSPMAVYHRATNGTAYNGRLSGPDYFNGSASPTLMSVRSSNNLAYLSAGKYR
ncbi:hypothetical protein LCGC14_2094630 [marine sediment metagenome]|uniref:Uncharacterized protein n=1 Tax=marine sediment metagenome TaxID=412755 RepID=A0A0F9GPT9_9ZZZZ